MARIIWKKQYTLEHKNGHFGIFVSKHSDGKAFAALWHYTREGSWKAGTDVKLNFKLETFTAKTADQAYEQCINWVDANLGTDYKILEE